MQRWVARRLGRIEHEQKVATIAATLFDVTSALHGLPVYYRRLLRMGALVHDVGRSVSDEAHPEEGASMLLADERLPLCASERRALAYLALHHRGVVPRAGKDALLNASDDAQRLRLTLALLRGADALDSRSLESPRLLFALVGPRDAQRLRVNCYLDEESAKARRVYSRTKKFRLLEELLELRVEIDIESARELRLVA